MSSNRIGDLAAATQKDMITNLAFTQEVSAKTYKTFKAFESKNARLAGLSRPFIPSLATGSFYNDHISGMDSFRGSQRVRTDTMFIGIREKGFNFTKNKMVVQDQKNGNIYLSEAEEKNLRLLTFLKECNWEAGSDGSAAVAYTQSCTAGGLATAQFNTDHRKNKAATFLLSSNPDATTDEDRKLYDVIDTTTNTVAATFYITSKPDNLTFNIKGATDSYATPAVTYTDTQAQTALNVAGRPIVPHGGYRLAINGTEYFANDSTTFPLSQMQGVNKADYPSMRPNTLDAGGVAVNPTHIFNAKVGLATRFNDEAKMKFIGHISDSCYATLASYGYQFGQYNLEKGTVKTAGVNPDFDDGDISWFMDNDFDDSKIILRNQTFKKYVFKPLSLDVTDGISTHPILGAYNYGSKNMYENWTVEENFYWDGNESNKQAGLVSLMASMAVIKNIQVSNNAQVYKGVIYGA